MTKTFSFLRTDAGSPSAKWVRLSFLLVLAGMLTGCHSFTLFTAKDFVVLDESEPYDFRATTSEGLVMAVRHFDNRSSHGELEFWSTAIENKLRLDQGYALLGRKEVTTLQGHKGVQLRFGLEQDADAQIYLVTIFVTESEVFVVEAGGAESLVKRHQKQIDWSIQEFQIH